MHPTVPLYIFVPAIVVLFTLGARELTTLGSLGLVAGGYLFWTLTEYWMHRLVFHFEPEEGSARGCTGSSTASTTTTRTIPCAWSCRRR